MAKRTPEPDYTNPDVRFERKDITPNSIFKLGVYLAIGTVIVVVTMLWYGDSLMRQYHEPDALALPPAATDDDRLPPEPRLEALEDLRDHRARLFPPRAAEYYKPQLDQLKLGNADKGILKIDEAMASVSKSLPVRKTGDGAAPEDFAIRLPSKASSGRTMTGAPR